MDEIWDLIESVSEGFPTYSYTFRIKLAPGEANLVFNNPPLLIRKAKLKRAE